MENWVDQFAPRHSVQPLAAILAQLHVVAHARHLLVFLRCLNGATQANVKLALCVELNSDLARCGLLATFL